MSIHHAAGQVLDAMIEAALTKPELAQACCAHFVLSTADKIASAHPDSDGDPALTFAEAILFASAFAAMEHIPSDAWLAYTREVKKLIGELFPEVLLSPSITIN